MILFSLSISLSPHSHQHLLYLQLRQDILEERLECDENRALSLAAFALQIECGNYQKELMGRNYFVPEYYFSKRILQLYGTGFIRDHTPDAHRSINGLSQDDAMAKFIRVSRITSFNYYLSASLKLSMCCVCVYIYLL